jgi:transcriptional regulator with XRE-family HTH domain
MDMGLVSKIRKKRIEKGWTQDELADKLGPTVTKYNISRWENGHTFPSLDMALRLSYVFDCDTREIIDLDEQSKEPLG